MFAKRTISSALVLAAALVISGGVQAEQQSWSPEFHASVAAHLAARGAFEATSARLDVTPQRNGSLCPETFDLGVYLSATKPGPLSYQFETKDGLVSQVFETEAVLQDDGRSAVRIVHNLALEKDNGSEHDPATVIFHRPGRDEPTLAEQFFEDLFGDGGEKDLREQEFLVKVLAPNAIASNIDSHIEDCEEETYRTVRVEKDDRERDRGTPGDRGRGGRGGGTPGAAN